MACFPGYDVATISLAFIYRVISLIVNLIIGGGSQNHGIGYLKKYTHLQRHPGMVSQVRP